MSRAGAAFVFMASVLLAGCLTVHRNESAGAALPKIEKVYFAQQHVLEHDNPLFKLVGGLDALIKVQVYSDAPVPSPYVFAILELDGRTAELCLRGPKNLPEKPDCDPVLMEQSYDDSFTAIIPKEWIKTGLKVAVELRDFDYSRVDADDDVFTNCSKGTQISILDKVALDNLKIGAPTKLVIQMFDIHYFGMGEGADYPDGWETELKAKLPVADLTINRLRGIVFKEIVMQPLFGLPSSKYSSIEDFKKKTGHDFDGEQGVAMAWCAALKAAGGTFGFWRPYNINIAGVHSGGMGGGYRSCANLHRHGVVHHELGHTFGLPHWASDKLYPYKRTMYGKDQGEPAAPNAGPTWAFDLGRREFLSPRVIQDGNLTWRKDPMHGGGRSNLKDYMFNQFSDYSVSRMQQRFENQAVYWNEETGKYAQWNQDTGVYDKVMENDGVKLPLQRDVDVISIMASANAAVPDANIVYAPIGPYKAGLIRRFDANSAEDREAAGKFGYKPDRCNVCLRVTQGGKTKAYLMPVKVSPDDDPMKAFNVSAINLSAADGEVTQAELLYDQGLLANGLTKESKSLYIWRKEGSTPPN
jgi:hypothetical protein